MDTEVIRQFLVSIGVQVDEKGLKRFDNTIKDITKTTKEFAEVLTAAAVAASVAVVKISEQFEDLYYASQRLHSSVENIKAFTFGVKQMGGNADAAMSSLEAFASFLRNNPAGAGVVRGFFGVDVSDKDAAGGLAKIGRRVRDMQAQGAAYWQIQQRAAMVGIDENTLQAMLRGTDQWSDQFHDIMQRNGVDMDALAASSTNLMQGFRKLTVEVEAHFLGLLQKIRPEVLEAGVVVAALAGTLGAVALVLGGVAAEFLAAGVALGLMADDFNAWKKGGGAFDWTEMANAIDSAVDSLKDLWHALKDLWIALKPIRDQWNSAIGPAVSSMLTIAGTLLHIIADVIRTIAALLSGDTVRAWANFKAAGLDAIHGIMDAMKDLIPFWHAINGQGDPGIGIRQAPGASRQARAAALAGGGGAANSNADRISKADAVAYFMRQGWTRAQAAGIVANLYDESGLLAHGKAGDGGRAKGVAQWHAPRQGDFAAFAGKTVDQANIFEQLAFVNYELTKGKYSKAGASLRGINNAFGAGVRVSAGYEEPADALGLERIKRGMHASDLMKTLGGDNGNRTVTINANTKIDVSGANDASATGKAVGSAVDQSNATLVRNTKAAVR